MPRTHMMTDSSGLYSEHSHPSAPMFRLLGLMKPPLVFFPVELYYPSITRAEQNDRALPFPVTIDFLQPCQVVLTSVLMRLMILL